jgi:putative acyl-CoA dehydrogenase
MVTDSTEAPVSLAADPPRTTAPAPEADLRVLTAATNQALPLVGANLYRRDPALRDAVVRGGAGWAEGALSALGARVNEADTVALARAADRSSPVLHTHDRFGARQDTVEFHPAYHALMSIACEAGLHSAPWADPRPGAHVARAAAFVLYGQVENGTQCPVTMTFASIPVLARHPDSLPWLREAWLPRLHTPAYDPRFVPIEGKRGATIGMGMTEKQGGSDVRANVTQARALGASGAGRPYRLRGHKWFMSAPMCDAFLVLAQAPGGLSCFFLPRFVDGRINALRFIRLKDKLGNRANASAEVEFDDATAYLLGDEGRGVPTIVEMVNVTRLDCALGSTSLMRHALAQALHHVQHRAAFGRRLAEQALMKNVLADLALEAEAATALSLWMAQLFDAGTDAQAGALKRLYTPAAKYWVCKRAPGFCQEAMEVLGGNGYVEDSVLPRLYREAPVNSIWEGSGNVMGLDLLRALQREPATREALQMQLAGAARDDARIAAAVGALLSRLHAPTEAQARCIAEDLVLTWQATLLLRHAPAAVSDAFIASRLQPASRCAAYGTLPAEVAVDAILARAWPDE